jgi:hypothetical protein
MTTPDWEMEVFSQFPTVELIAGDDLEKITIPFKVHEAWLDEELGFRPREVVMREIVFNDYIDTVKPADNYNKRVFAADLQGKAYRTALKKEPKYQSRGKYLISESTENGIIRQGNSKTFYSTVRSAEGKETVVRTMSGFESKLSTSTRAFYDDTVKVLEVGRFGADIGKSKPADFPSMFYKIMQEADSERYNTLIMMTGRRDARVYRKMMGEHSKNLVKDPSFTGAKKQAFMTANSNPPNSMIVDTQTLRNWKTLEPYDPKRRMIEIWESEGLNLNELIHEGELWKIMFPREMYKNGIISPNHWKDFVDMYGEHPVLLEVSLTEFEITPASIASAEELVKDRLGIGN